MKKRICFIVNPFSGVNKKKLLLPKIQQLLDVQKYDYAIKYTEAVAHAIELSKQAVQEGFDIVVAVGGDGSINEVAQGLIGTKTILGILPAGSGNGFAMHLGLGRKLDKAIQILNEAHVLTIDTCMLNERPYVNLAGVGFDALVAYKMKKSALRGLWGYVKFSLKEALNFQFPKYKITLDDQTIERDCIVTEVANAPMFGYNFLIAPQAKLNDGLLDITIIKKAPKWRYFFSFWRFFNGSIHKSSLVESYTAKKVSIEIQEETAVHVDGEGYLINQNLHFSLNPLSLKVIVPKDYTV